MTFTLKSPWSRDLFIALCRRYELLLHLEETTQRIIRAAIHGEGGDVDEVAGALAAGSGD